MDKKKEWLRTAKFVLFSISAGVIQIASCTLLNEVLQMTYWVAYLISLCLSVLWNFTLNRKFTFIDPHSYIENTCYNQNNRNNRHCHYCKLFHPITSDNSCFYYSTVKQKNNRFQKFFSFS